MTANVNEPRFVAFPKEMVTGACADECDVDELAAALEGAGIAPERIQFLRGEEGLRILNEAGRSGGSFVQRLIRKLEQFSSEGRILESNAAHLRAGRAVFAVFGVKAAERETVEDICRAHGVRELHYLGRVAVD